MELFPCGAEPDIFMRKKDFLYEYIVVYADDLVIAAKTHKEVTHTLMMKHDLKLKGTGPIKYHSGCDCFIDETGTLCFFTKEVY